jgi:hypothetical protein
VSVVASASRLVRWIRSDLQTQTHG